ncbi:Patatin-like phospholipase domain-containing protein [Diplonema papillatum]|nr:Patatin-like phospholipase domain-containing protein [Diplonema papillatum]
MSHKRIRCVDSLADRRALYVRFYDFIINVFCRTRQKIRHTGRQSKGHLLLRAPLCMFFGIVMFMELVAYLYVRLAVAALEYVFARRKRSGVKLHRLRRAARTFEEYMEICRQIDIDEGRDKWKYRPQSQHYDHQLLQTALRRIRLARSESNVRELMEALCMNRNYGGMMNLELYTKTWSGTKLLIEEYTDEVVTSLQWLSDVEIQEGSHLHVERQMYFQKAKAEFGNSALLLSGGAMMGLYHFGICKALLNAGVLPRILSGTSAGSVVGSIIATRNDDELKEIFADTTELHRRFGEHGPFWGGKFYQMKQALKNGAMYPFANFYDKILWFTRDMTFLEAYEVSGRVFNITCTPTKTNVKHHPPHMLNHITAPHVPIAYAVCASSCVPFLMEPVTIMERVKEDQPHHGPTRYMKTEEGKYIERPFLESVDDISGVRMRDGTFESDIPLLHMAHSFNSQFNIVSQVNPHVVPFFFNNIGEAGKPLRSWYNKGGWRGGFILSLAELWLKEDMRKNLKIIGATRILFDVLGVDWSHLWLQESFGEITLTPQMSLQYFWDMWKVTENLPSTPAGKAELDSKILESERNVWKAIPMTRNRMRIQNVLDDACVKHAHYGPSTFQVFTPHKLLGQREG